MKPRFLGQLLNGLYRIVNQEKYDEAEKFFLENYPPCLESRPMTGIDCKLYKSSDLVNALKIEKGITLSIQQCEELLHVLGYKRILAREPFTTTFYPFWLIKR